jgi:hypothetical protein
MYHQNSLSSSRREFSGTFALFVRFEAQGLFFEAPSWWRGVDDVNDRPIGNPKRRYDEHNNKFSLSYETKV